MTRAKEAEEFIGTIDVCQLNPGRRPIMRVLAPAYVHRMNLNAYLERLLQSGEWRRVRATPHEDDHTHLFDVFGTRKAAPVADILKTQS